VTYAELAEHLKTHNVRLGLRLTVQCDDAGAVLTPEVKAALAEHKPLLVARVAANLQWSELSAWQWGQGEPGSTPPF
jgi:hypothetical protein